MVDALSQILRLRDNEHAQAVSGKRDENLRLVESAFGVKIVPRGLELLISGSDEAVSKTKKALTNIASLGTNLTSHDVYYAIQLSENGESTDLNELSADVVVATHRGKIIRPKTSGQRRYIGAISRNDIVFGIG